MSSTYNFDAENNWIEFYITLKRPLGRCQMNAIFNHLNRQIENLQKKKDVVIFL